MLKVVLDNNTIISAIINPYGSPGKVLDKAFRGAFIFASSPHLIQELSRVLESTKMTNFLAKRGKSKADIPKFIENFTKAGFWTEDIHLAEKVCRDPDDDWVLACALQAQADCIVTGDDDLLSLKEYESIRILSAGDFLKKFE